MTNRKLDYWIAENPMGWKLTKQISLSPRDDFFWGQNGEFIISDYDWRPTESISDAFQVVEKITKNGTQVEMGKNLMGDEDWYCVFGIDPEYIAYANSLSLAICLAAKKAIEEVDVPLTTPSESQDS